MSVGGAQGVGLSLPSGGVEGPGGLVGVVLFGFGAGGEGEFAGGGGELAGPEDGAEVAVDGGDFAGGVGDEDEFDGAAVGDEVSEDDGRGWVRSDFPRPEAADLRGGGGAEQRFVGLAVGSFPVSADAVPVRGTGGEG